MSNKTKKKNNNLEIQIVKEMVVSFKNDIDISVKENLYNENYLVITRISDDYFINAPKEEIIQWAKAIIDTFEE